MRNVPGVELQLALDMDMIGLLGTEIPELEYQYIRGLALTMIWPVFLKALLAMKTNF